MRIALGQLLQYFDQSENNRIQIVTRDQDWECAGELYMDSELLKPFDSCFITDMGYEYSFIDGEQILRVSIDC